MYVKSLIPNGIETLNYSHKGPRSKSRTLNGDDTASALSSIVVSRGAIVNNGHDRKNEHRQALRLVEEVPLLPVAAAVAVEAGRIGWLTNTSTRAKG
jgi:hypothetical protein